MEPISLEITLCDTIGPAFHVGEPRVFMRLKAVHLPGTAFDEGRISILARDRIKGGWREYTCLLNRADSQTLLEQLHRLGYPDRNPKVFGILDTADSWMHLLLRVRLGDRSQVLEVDMHSTGMTGPDAEKLRVFCRRVFALVGFEDFDETVYGPRPRPIAQ